MHITHPSLSTTGKKSGKKKFRNAEEARRFRELEASWQDLNKKWAPSAPTTTKKRTEKLEYSLSVPENRSNKHIKSLGTGVGVATATPAKIYTGDKIKGISQMAKSNAVPVFNQDHIIEIARMRR